ncbi:hypothetical protein VNO77_03065 [Canavalia gladiata]|uniref:Uncharacterized protein n=1 Tax=Canavalia gladiata TaxID=3824 RepID=A0AAN9R7T6_CANGL
MQRDGSSMVVSHCSSKQMNNSILRNVNRSSHGSSKPTKNSMLLSVNQKKQKRTKSDLAAASDRVSGWALLVRCQAKMSVRLRQWRFPDRMSVFDRRRQWDRVQESGGVYRTSWRNHDEHQARKSHEQIPEWMRGVLSEYWGVGLVRRNRACCTEHFSMSNVDENHLNGYHHGVVRLCGPPAMVRSWGNSALHPDMRIHSHPSPRIVSIHYDHKSSIDHKNHGSSQETELLAPGVLPSVKDLNLREIRPQSIDNEPSSNVA